MTSLEITQRVSDLLNSAFEADPEAIHTLICNRIPCNTKLREHPDIVVDANRAVPGKFSVGLLGVINGILHDLGAEPVELCWEGDTIDQSHRCIGFRARK